MAPDASPPLDPHDPVQIAGRVAAWAGGAPQGPVTLELYPTLACNLDCLFCDTTERKRPPVRELSAARLLSLIDEAAAMGVRRVFVLGGGEPLARRDCAPALLERVKRWGMEGVLTTNGTLLGPSLAAQLVDLGWDEVHFSVDGARPATHDALRGRPGLFRQTVRNACRLAVLRGRARRSTPRTALHFVITQRNWSELEGVVELAAALGAHRVDFDALIAYTDEQRALSLSPAARSGLPAVAARAAARARALGIATTLDAYTVEGAADRGERAPVGGAAPGLGGAPCLKAWHHLVVQADGRMSPCCVLAGGGGDVRDQPLWQAWTGDPFLQTVRARMRAHDPLPRCRECSPNILGHEARIREALAPLLGGPTRTAS